MDVNKLFKDWKKDHALLISHIGNSTGHVGLKTPADQLTIDTKGLRAAGLGSGVDILKLDFGKYVGQGFINAPDGIASTDYVVVTVTGYPNVLREFHLVDANDNITYSRTIYYQGLDTGWSDNQSLSAGFKDIQLINGFSGLAKVSKINSESFQGLEIRLDISGKITAGNVNFNFGILPAGFTTLQAKRISFTGTAAPFAGDITNDNFINNNYQAISAIGLSIGEGNNLYAHRTDANTTDTISIKANGFIKRGTAI